MKTFNKKFRRRLGELQLRLDPVSFISDIHDQYGKQIKWGKDDPPTIMVVGHELTREVLSNRSYINQTLRGPKGSGLEILLNGLVFLNGSQHQVQRRLIAPSFHKAAITDYFDTMIKVSEKCVDTIPSSKSFDLIPILTDYTFRVTLQCLFGIDGDYRELGEKINDWVKALTNPLAYIIPKTIPGLPYYRLLKISDELVADTAKVLNTFREQSARSSIMAALMTAEDEDGNKLSDEELIGHLNLIFLAGHETSRNALSFIFFLLAQHPKVAKELVDNIQQATTDGISLDKITEIKYLDWVIHESLRLLPPTAWMDKYVSSDEDNDGVVLDNQRYPPGTMIILSHYLNHRDPEIYQKPRQYIPKRWANLSPPPYSFIPFGGGFRRCIGSEFAMLEMKALIVVLLRKYGISLVPQQKLNRLIRATMRIKGPLLTNALESGRFERSNVYGSLVDMVDYT